MSAVVADAVEHLVRGIVDNPDDVRVDMVTNRRGRTVEVHVHPDDLGKVYVRSTAGAMVPVGALIKVRQQVGAEQLERFTHTAYQVVPYESTVELAEKKVTRQKDMAAARARKAASKKAEADAAAEID